MHPEGEVHKTSVNLLFYCHSKNRFSATFRFKANGAQRFRGTNRGSQGKLLRSMFLIGFATGSNGRIALLQVVVGAAEEVPAGSWWLASWPSGPNVWHTQRSLCVKVWGNDFERGWPLVRKQKTAFNFKCILNTKEFSELAWTLETLKNLRQFGNLPVYPTFPDILTL